MRTTYWRCSMPDLVSSSSYGEMRIHSYVCKQPRMHAQHVRGGEGMQNNTNTCLNCMHLEFGTCPPVIAGMTRAAEELKQHESMVSNRLKRKQAIWKVLV